MRGAGLGSADFPCFCLSAFSAFLPRASVTSTARKKNAPPKSRPGRRGRSWRPDAVPPPPADRRSRTLGPGAEPAGPLAALTCAALAAGLAAGAPSRASSTRAGRRHRAPSTAPSRRAWSRAPDAAEGTQAPRPMAPADWLSGLRAAWGCARDRRSRGGAGRGGAGRLGLQPRGGAGRLGGAAAPEGNQLAARCGSTPPPAAGRGDPGPVGRWQGPGQGLLGGVTWAGRGQGGPGRQDREGTG